MSISPAQLQAYVNWLNAQSPPGSLGDSFLGGPLAPIATVYTLPSISALRGLTGSSGAAVMLTGYVTQGDKPPVLYYWSTTSSATDNGGSVIKPTAVSGNGRWLLAPPEDGYYNLCDFGALDSSGGTDYTTQLVALLATGYNCQIGAGSWLLSTQSSGVVGLITTAGQGIRGAGRGLTTIMNTISTGVLFQLSAADAFIRDLSFSGGTDGWMISCQAVTSATPLCILRDLGFDSVPGIIAVGEHSGWVDCHNIYATNITGGTCDIVDGTENTAKAGLYGWGTSGDSGPWLVSDCLIGAAADSPFYGLYLNGAVNSGVFQNIYQDLVDTALLMNNAIVASGTVPNFNKFINFATQTPACTLGTNCAIILNDGEVTEFEGFLFVNQSSGGGVIVGANPRFVNFATVDINGCAGIGFDAAGTSITVNGGRILNSNSGNTSTTNSNVKIGSAATNVIIANLIEMGGNNVATDVIVSSAAGGGVLLLNNNYSATTFVSDPGFVASITPPVMGLPFTPTFAFGTPSTSSWTYTTQVGYVYIEGTRVTITVQLEGHWSGGSPSGILDIVLTGLPAAINSTEGVCPLSAAVGGLVLSSGYTQVSAETVANTNIVNLIQSGSTEAPAIIGGTTEVPTGTNIYVTLRGSYTQSGLSA